MLFKYQKRKPLEPALRGVFYSVFLWWLIPQAGHRLFITVQPFVDAMTHYTSHDSKYETYYVIHSHLLSVPVGGGNNPTIAHDVLQLCRTLSVNLYFRIL